MCTFLFLFFFILKNKLSQFARLLFIIIPNITSHHRLLQLGMLTTRLKSITSKFSLHIKTLGVYAKAKKTKKTEKMDKCCTRVLLASIINNLNYIRQLIIMTPHTTKGWHCHSLRACCRRCHGSCRHHEAHGQCATLYFAPRFLPPPPFTLESLNDLLLTFLALGETPFLTLSHNKSFRLTCRIRTSSYNSTL